MRVVSKHWRRKAANDAALEHLHFLQAGVIDWWGATHVMVVPKWRFLRWALRYWVTER